MPNFQLAPDIEENILTALTQVFTTEMVTTVVPGDVLSLKTLQPAPLQLDPTLVAPYLVYGPCPDKGHSLVESGEQTKQYGDVEIGGPIKFVRYYTATCGTPIVTTRESCYAQINNLATRVVSTLIKYFDLAGVLMIGPMQSQDGSKIIEGANPLLIDEVLTSLEGGEQTWFGKGLITWHYPVAWYQQYRVFVSPNLAH